jgi:hypothetical protein
MKRLGNREIRAITNTIGGLLIADYTRVIPFVPAIVPVAIIVGTLAIAVILALLAATTAAFAAFAFSHIFLYKENIKK